MHRTLLMLHRMLSAESPVPNQWLVVLQKPTHTRRTDVSDVLTLDACSEETRFTPSLGMETDAH